MSTQKKAATATARPARLEAPTAAFAIAPLPVEEGVEPDEVPEPEGEVLVVAASEVEMGVATESVAFLHETLEGIVALSESVRSAH